MATREPAPSARRRLLRRLLAALAILSVAGALAGYVGYRVLFAKNPEVVKEIRQAAQTQRELDDIFAEPATDAPAPAVSAEPPTATEP
jgi:hypothetical protein